MIVINCVIIIITLLLWIKETDKNEMIDIKDTCFEIILLGTKKLQTELNTLTKS